MAQIKLLHITSSLKIGGAEHVLYTLIAGMDKNRFEHHIIYFHEGPYVEKLKQLGVPVYQIKGLLFRYDPIFFVRLYLLIKILNPDCMHTLLWVANVAGRICAWLQAIPCVSVFHNNVATDGALRNFLDRLTLHLSGTLIAVSQPVQESVQRYLACSKTIRVIHNGIEVSSAFGSGKTREALSLQDHHFIIGTVGRFEPIKRYDLFLACVAPLIKKYPHVRVCLIGLGSQEQALRAQAQQLGIAHEVLFVIGQPAQQYYSLFDCFAQTTAHEGISIALLEAMSFERPCVVMHDEDRHPVIEHLRDGIVVDAADFRGFQASLEKIITDKKIGDGLGAAARQKVLHSFDVRSMIQGYEETIHFEISSPGIKSQKYR